MESEQLVPTGSTRLTRDDAPALDALLDAKQLWVYLYFMGRILTVSQLQAWTSECLGPNSIDQFTFLCK